MDPLENKMQELLGVAQAHKLPFDVSSSGALQGSLDALRQVGGPCAPTRRPAQSCTPWRTPMPPMACPAWSCTPWCTLTSPMACACLRGQALGSQGRRPKSVA